MAVDLAKVAKDKKLKYFLISFVDLFGVLRAKLVPARAIKGMQKDGAGFAGFAAWLDMTPAHPDMFAVPDPDGPVASRADVKSAAAAEAAKHAAPKSKKGKKPASHSASGKEKRRTKKA